jgi:hypothetical protein
MTGPTKAQQRRHAEIVQALGETGFALPGTLLLRYNKCGKPNCRCKQDPPVLHGPYYQWTRRIDGRTVTRVLSNEQGERYGEWFDTAQRVRQLVAELEALSLNIAAAAEGWT